MTTVQTAPHRGVIPSLKGMLKQYLSLYTTSLLLKRSTYESWTDAVVALNALIRSYLSSVFTFILKSKYALLSFLFPMQSLLLLVMAVATLGLGGSEVPWSTMMNVASWITILLESTPLSIRSASPSTPCLYGLIL